MNCLAAFEKSEHAADWRELMPLFMVRRTRSFIQKNYAATDCPQCDRPMLARQTQCPACQAPKPPPGRAFLLLEDGTKFYFPRRRPRTLAFRIRDKDPDDQYARLYSNTVVDTIRVLPLPRYGLANYLQPPVAVPRTQSEAEVADNLSRAGKRLIGFCRTNLFKRLESSGSAFLQSIQRHILRNYLYLHAIETGQPLPIGAQDAALFDPRGDDADDDTPTTPGDFFDGGPDHASHSLNLAGCNSLADFRKQAAAGYDFLTRQYRHRFDWLRPALFIEALAKHWQQDVDRLFSILTLSGHWQADPDTKLGELVKLITKQHPREKILVFSQFADTVDYLNAELIKRGVKELAAVTAAQFYFCKMFEHLN